MLANRYLETVCINNQIRDLQTTLLSNQLKLGVSQTLLRLSLFTKAILMFAQGDSKGYSRTFQEKEKAVAKEG